VFCGVDGRRSVFICPSLPFEINTEGPAVSQIIPVSVLAQLFQGDIYFLSQPYRGPELKYLACLSWPPGNIKHTKKDKQRWSLWLKLGAEEGSRVCVCFPQTWSQKDLKSIGLFCIKASCFSVLIKTSCRTSRQLCLLPHSGCLVTTRVFLKCVSYWKKKKTPQPW